MVIRVNIPYSACKIVAGEREIIVCIERERERLCYLASHVSENKCPTNPILGNKFSASPLPASPTHLVINFVQLIFSIPLSHGTVFQSMELNCCVLDRVNLPSLPYLFELLWMVLQFQYISAIFLLITYTYFGYLIYLLIITQIKLGTMDQTEAQTEWVIRPFMNTSKKQKILGD